MYGEMNNEIIKVDNVYFSYDKIKEFTKQKTEKKSKTDENSYKENSGCDSKSCPATYGDFSLNIDMPFLAEEKDRMVLKSINISIKKGQFVVVVGRNGSGKSTFARLLNALLIPTSGHVYIKGMNTADEENIWEIRKTAGMIFQNPDNQIVGTTVEEDVAFGPENIGIKPGEIRKRVNEALESVHMFEYMKHAPHLLSGGQKQRVAIAGVLAIKPECIILDESTAMLDPIGRREVMSLIKSLNKKENITIIHITHHMDEAVEADRVIVMDNGNVIMDGKPEEVFTNVDKMKACGLSVPQVTELFFELKKEGVNIPTGILDIETAFKCLSLALKKG